MEKTQYTLPIPGCPWINEDDGTCTNPEAPTPECHVDACLFLNEGPKTEGQKLVEFCDRMMGGGTIDNPIIPINID